MTLRPPLLAAAAGLALAACQPDSGEVAAPVVLKTTMQDIAARQNDLVNVLIEALDADGEIDPAALSEEQWATLTAAAAGLSGASLALRDGAIEVVATPGEAIEGQDAPGALDAAAVQARIDQDPEGFVAEAETLVAALAPLATASDSRDAAAMWELALDMDAPCMTCHERFWYPE